VSLRRAPASLDSGGAGEQAKTESGV
jgi:hypothetical protein